jgi:hypothetical protein
MRAPAHPGQVGISAAMGSGLGPSEGPYRLSRNPLYVGLLTLYLGLALLAPTFWGLVLFPERRGRPLSQAEASTAVDIARD